MNELKEKLATIEHERWADWQRHVHCMCIPSAIENGMVIPTHLVQQWERQINTSYADLSEEERQSDRDQVDRYWDLIPHWIPVPELPKIKGLYLTKGFDMKFYVRDFDPNNPNDISTWCRGVIKYMEITE